MLTVFTQHVQLEAQVEDFFRSSCSIQWLP